MLFILSAIFVHSLSFLYIVINVIRDAVFITFIMALKSWYTVLRIPIINLGLSDNSFSFIMGTPVRRRLSKLQNWSLSYQKGGGCCRGRPHRSNRWHQLAHGTPEAVGQHRTRLGNSRDINLYRYKQYTDINTKHIGPFSIFLLFTAVGDGGITRQFENR